jgi:PAS domain S-box-containing protein
MDNKNLSHDTNIDSLEKSLAVTEALNSRLVAENALLRQLYDKASLNVQSLDINGNILSVNQAWIDAFGYSTEEVVGKNFSDFLHPDWQDHFRENFPRLKAVGEILGVEFQMQKKDGSYILVSFSGKIVKDVKGNVKHTLCIFQDITQQKKLEEALIRSETKWRNIIVSIPQLGISLDPQGRILFINSHFTQVVGWSQQEIIGQDWFDTFIPSHSREEARKVFHTEIERNDFVGSSTYENEIVTRTGELRNVVWSTVISKDGDSNILEITCLGVDLTEKNLAAEKLRESQDLIERIIHTIPWRVFWKDTNLVYRGCNTSFANDAGFDDPRHIVGKDDYELLPDQAELYRSDDLQVIESGQPKLFIEEPQTTPDGKVIYLLTSKVPLRNSKGEISGVLGTYIDITNRKELEALNESLQTQMIHVQKMEAIGQLAAGIAHEINTPSQYLANNISFLGESFKEVEALLNQYDTQVQKESQKLAAADQFINQFTALKEQIDWEYLKEEIPLAIVQSEDGLAKIRSIVLAMKEFSHPGSKEKQATDVNHLIDTTLTICRSEWKQVAEIVLQIDPHLPQVPCLRDELGQVFLNILVNAAQAISSKFGKNPEIIQGRITIASRTLDDHAEITFTDTGGGIPQNIQHKIFDPFFTTKEVGRGTGQGLAIAYDIIVNKHGGKIDCSSIVGESTTIRILLPREG